MPGCVLEGTPIAVDFWRPVKAPQARLFFLTHLHTDHTSGLTSTWRIPLYTSPINAALLKWKYKLTDSILHKLEVGQSYLIPLDEGKKHNISVTVLDANHVPGAVMFLFQGYFGNILYCGDMRWYPGLLEDPVLRGVVEARELDILHLDNTYSAPYCVFPPRNDAKEQIFKIIDEYSDHVIKIGIQKLGREDLLEEIAERFQERILVSKEKYEQLQVLGYSDFFTTDPEMARIHTVLVTKITLSAHTRWNSEHATISIIPSALYVGWKNGPYTSQSCNGIFVVPYSDHSSYPELMEMVAQLAPHQVYPIVNYWPANGWWSEKTAPDQQIKGDMTVYRHLLTPPPPKPVVIPENIIKLMNTRGLALHSPKPRRCALRQGLSPRRSQIRGVVYTCLETPSKQPISYTPPTTPTSFTTVRSITSGTPDSPLHYSSLDESPRTLKTRSLFSPSSDNSKSNFEKRSTAIEKGVCYISHDIYQKSNSEMHSVSHSSSAQPQEESQHTISHSASHSSSAQPHEDGQHTISHSASCSSSAHPQEEDQHFIPPNASHSSFAQPQEESHHSESQSASHISAQPQEGQHSESQSITNSFSTQLPKGHSTDDTSCFGESVTEIAVLSSEPQNTELNNVKRKKATSPQNETEIDMAHKKQHVQRGLSDLTVDFMRQTNKLLDSLNEEPDTRTYPSAEEVSSMATDAKFILESISLINSVLEHSFR